MSERSFIRSLSRLYTIGLLLTGLFGICTAGCAAHNYNTYIEPVTAPFQSGDYAAAASAAATLMTDVGDRDRVVVLLERGAALRAAGDYSQSNAVLDEVYQRMEELGDPTDAEIREEFVSALTNATALTYRGTNYDRVMCSTYHALNALALGNTAEARVAFKRAQFAQDDAERRFNKSIENQEKAINDAAETEASTNKADKVDAAEVKKNSGVQEVIKTGHADLEATFKPYAGYINPYTELVAGLFYLYQGVDSADRTQASFCLGRARGIVGNNSYLDADLELAATSKNADGLTYVLVEAGLAPSRNEFAITIPSVFPNQPPVGISFPRLIPSGGLELNIQVQCESGTFQTANICSIDSLIAREFDNDFDLVIFHTAMSAITRAAISFGIERAMKDQSIWVKIATKISTTVITYVLNHADLRTWRTLPQQVAYCRLPTPQDRKININWSGQSAQVGLIDGKVNVVVVKSAAPAAPLAISQFILR